MTTPLTPAERDAALDELREEVVFNAQCGSARSARERDALDQLRAEVAERDARIADLEMRLAATEANYWATSAETAEMIRQDRWWHTYNAALSSCRNVAHRAAFVEARLYAKNHADAAHGPLTPTAAGGDGNHGS